MFINPLSEPVHKKALEFLRRFLILGGMPEVVSAYVSKNDLLECQRTLDDLIISFRSDFAKYREKVPTLQISAVFDSVVTQMGKKFVCANVSRDYAHRQLKDGLELLKSGSCYEQKTLYYWHRESKNSNAEVDFVLQIGQNIVPLYAIGVGFA